MPNRLAFETSPYLLQHRENPVDWYPWGEEARAASRERDRPLLVSVGYSACHWCHVMERESFEDPDIAALMNELFVPIKVDREERPDVDAVCMDACQTLTGQGGWPLHAFLTPDGIPFFAGTYFPPEPRHGLPSWRMVLDAVAGAWRERRPEILEQGRRLGESLAATARLEPGAGGADQELLNHAEDVLRRGYDASGGGWGRAPKFPQSSNVEFLLARGEREIPLHTLRAMASGGIFDQLAGGFSRYSVDADWRVPHFEKMLYDNALLARCYLHGWQLSGEPRLLEVCRETLDWALAEMRGPEGGFASSLDADSEGVEGRFYMWREAEIRALLEPADAAAAISHFGVSTTGNFEDGQNVLQAHGPRPERFEAIRRALLSARAERVRPARDDKRLTAWNALMIHALAECGAVLEHPPYLQAAETCASFLLSELRDGRENRLLRTWKDGRAHIEAFLEDHAHLLSALITLYEATFDAAWYEQAVELADTMIERFADPRHGGFFTTAADHEALATRRKDLDDSPVPSGNSAAAHALLRLAGLSGEERYERCADGVVALLAPLARRQPAAFGELLQVADLKLGGLREVAIVGPDPEPLLRAVRGSYHPRLVLAGAENDRVPLLRNREPVDGRATAYVCERFVCQAPVTGSHELSALLDSP